jgi:hypothetical protein
MSPRKRVADKVRVDIHERIWRIARLAWLLDVHWSVVHENYYKWYNSMSHLITWREALNLTEQKVALGDPLPWEEPQ